MSTGQDVQCNSIRTEFSAIKNRIKSLDNKPEQETTIAKKQIISVCVAQ